VRGERESETVRALTLRIILVHPNNAFLVARDEGQLLVRKEKVGSSHADLDGILRQDDEFVWIFLFRASLVSMFPCSSRVEEARTWKATNQTLFTASPMISKFFNARSVVT